MWVTYVIAGAFFLAFIAVGYFGFKEREEGAERMRAGSPPEPSVLPGLLAGPPRRHAPTSDEVVLAVEHRIDEELRDISHALRAPERYPQLYDA
jgi:hypothetical protein